MLFSQGSTIKSFFTNSIFMMENIFLAKFVYYFLFLWPNFQLFVRIRMKWISATVLKM